MILAEDIQDSAVGRAWHREVTAGIADAIMLLFEVRILLAPFVCAFSK